MSSNQIGPEGANNLVLPQTLHTLILKDNHIGRTGAGKLQLPPQLHTLILNLNKIGDAGASNLTLPWGLHTLGLLENNIGNVGASKLTLPPFLKNLYLVYNNITSEGLKELVLPPGIQHLDILSFYSKITPEQLQSCLQLAHSEAGVDRYAATKEFYRVQMCKPVWIEICRGLMMGHTDDPMFQFLQRESGATNIRQCILSYFNPHL